MRRDIIMASRFQLRTRQTVRRNRHGQHPTPQFFRPAGLPLSASCAGIRGRRGTADRHASRVRFQSGSHAGAHRQYVRTQPRDRFPRRSESVFSLPAKPEVGFGWATNRHPASSVRLHHEMVLHVLHEAGGAHGIPPERRILVGFSQPVSFNYRFAATCPEAVRGVVALCGGLPSDWETGAYQPVTASVLHIARRADEYYAPAVTEQYPARLRIRVSDAEFHLLEGGHRFPSKGASIAESWLSRIRQQVDRR